MAAIEMDPKELALQFHHIHVYADSLLPLADYERLSKSLNALSNRGSFDPFSGGMRFLQTEALPARVEEGRKEWDGLVDEADRRSPDDYISQQQDLVEQLIVGLGWRVTAEYIGCATRSVLVTSADPRGVKFCVTCVLPGSGDGDAEPYDHFKKAHVERFLAAHAGRAGVACLGFEVDERGGVEAILQRYRKVHPALLVQKPAGAAGPSSPSKRTRRELAFEYTDTRTVHAGSSATPSVSSVVELGRMHVGEVFAYYAKGGTQADTGTVMRFVERFGTFGSRPGFANPEGVLPGFTDVAPTFDGTSIPAYSDHWVSNVIDREGFLKTLEDTLGFTPKVDFNAGVVAAGEARIESTVTGNTSRKLASSGADALINQSQVYLPINNALSPVGHVHFFLEELGQGIQHLASRVNDLKAFIERVNNYRLITGRGFTFLNIPRSYYGRLDTALLARRTTCTPALCEALVGALVQGGLLTKTGILDLAASDEALHAAVAGAALEGPAALGAERDAKLAALVACVKHSRYANLYSLLKDHLSEKEYLQIVRNKILVDIQGGDILYQIFTSNILQRKAGDESPFLEFIERVCAETRCKGPDEICAKPIKPGCGGFGIRNFLTLFLSIEVSKAMRELSAAEESKDAAAGAVAEQKILLLTEQLDVSNPILTSISDAMTIEGDCLTEIAATEDPAKKAVLQARADEMRVKKEAGNAELQGVSAKYAAAMKALRK